MAIAPDGAIVQFNDNGVWCWFEDNRAIIDPTTNQLLISTIANGDGVGGAARDSHIEVVSYNLTTNTVTNPYTLIDYGAVLGIISDDHNTPALSIRADGRYVATYTAHQNDSVIRTRVSTNAGDATSWGAEQTLTLASNQGTTYSNVYKLSSNGVTYDFYRGNNYDPHVLTSTDDGATYSYAGHLLMDPGNSAGARPYVRYASNGVDKIYFLTTTGHPRDSNTGIYAGYMTTDQHVHALDGTDLGPLGTNGGAATSASAFTPVMPANTVVNGSTRTHMWSTDIELDSGGKPFMGFTSRVNSSTADHRFYYSRLTDTGLVTNEIARAGGFLYSAEPDYTGLMALNPSDANTLYISTKIDPRDSTGATTTGKYEIYRGFTTDTGATWTWVPITIGSTEDNLRPTLPTWDNTHTALLWLQGTYTTYQHTDLAVVGKFYTGNNGAWTNAAGGTWGASGNWVDGRVGDGMSFIADFSTLDISGAKTVSLGGGTRNLGFVTFGDTDTATAGSWTVNGGTLNLDGGVIAPIINVANSTATVAATLTGTQGVTKAGVGTLTLAGANAYTGPTVVSAGTLTASGGAAIPDSSVVTVASGATFTVASASETVGGLSGSGAVSASNNTTLVVGGGNASADFAGVISGGVRLTKTGTGTQTLSGANTTTGATAITGGTLALGNGGSLGGTAVTVGATLASLANNTIGTSGSPTVSLTANAGKLSLVSGGNNTLTINSATASATVLTINGGNTLSFDSSAVGGDSIVLGAGLRAVAGGANTININLLARPTATQTLTLINAPGGLTGANTFSLGTFTGVSPFGVSFALASTATQLQLVETTAAAPATAYFVGNRGTAWSANNGTLGNFSTTAAGTTFVTQLPDATTDVHLYAAGATLASVAASTLDTPFAIKTLSIDGGSAPVGIAATGSGSLTIKPATSTAGIAVNAGAGATTITAPVILGAAQTWTNSAATPLAVSGSTVTNGGFRLTLAGTGPTTIASAIGGGGGLTKSGAGTAVLAGNNTFTGSITVSGGTLQVGDGGTSGALSPAAAIVNNGILAFNRADAITQSTHFASVVSGSGALTQFGPGTLVLNGANTYTGNTVVSGGTLTASGGAAIPDGSGVIILGAGTFNVAGSESVGSFSGSGKIVVAGGTTLTYAGNAGTSYAGNISGGGLLTKAGSGTLTLSGNNTFGGALSVSNGAVSVASVAANTGTNNTINLGSGSGVGTLIYTGTGEVTPKSIYQSAGAAANGGTLDMSGTGTLEFAGNTLAASQYQAHTLTLQGSTSGVGQIDGVITDATSALKTTLLKQGTGTWVLAGANGYTGATTVSAGTLQLGDGVAGHDGTIAFASPISVAADGTLAYNRFGNSTDAHAITGAGGVTKLGPGTQSLTGANTYAGPTAVLAGRLRVTAAATNNLLTNAGGVDLGNADGVLVLDYTGAASPVTTVNAILASGYDSDFATGRIRSTTLAADRTIGYTDDGVGQLTVRVTFGGDANLDGTVDFNDFIALQTNYGLAGGRFDLGDFNYDDVVDFNDFIVLQTHYGNSLTGQNVVTSSEQLAAMTAFGVANAVPEPASLAAIGLGIYVAGRRRRV